MKEISEGFLNNIKDRFLRYENYYQVLKISKNGVTDKIVEEAYKKQIKQLEVLFTNYDQEGIKELKQLISTTLNDAYLTLKTENSRKQYELQGKKTIEDNDEEQTGICEKKEKKIIEKTDILEAALSYIEKEYTKYKNYYQVLRISKNGVTDEIVENAYRNQINRINEIFSNFDEEMIKEIKEMVYTTLNDAYIALRTENSRKHYEDILDGIEGEGR